MSATAYGVGFYIALIVPMFFVLLGIQVAYYRRKYPRIDTFKQSLNFCIPNSAIGALIWPLALTIIFFLNGRFKYGLQFKCEHSRVKEIERYTISNFPVGNTLQGDNIHIANGKCFCYDCNKTLVLNYRTTKVY